MYINCCNCRAQLHNLDSTSMSGCIHSCIHTTLCTMQLGTDNTDMKSRSNLQTARRTTNTVQYMAGISCSCCTLPHAISRTALYMPRVTEPHTESNGRKKCRQVLQLHDAPCQSARYHAGRNGIVNTALYFAPLAAASMQFWEPKLTLARLGTGLRQA